MADVFISYARPDAAVASRVADTLRAGGYSVWFDQDLPAHRSYSEVIEEQLEAAAAVVVLWSKDSAASQWVRSEANRARETGRLVQLRLDDTRLPMPFDQIQCADLRKWNRRADSPAWRLVDASIAELLGQNRPAQPPPPGPHRRLPALDRRMVIAGGAAVAALGWWWVNRPEPLAPEAQLLLQKGLDALQQNDALDPEDEGSTAQAIALLTEATRAAPRSAVAWGGLALAYAARKRSAPADQVAGLRERGLAAARTALDLDGSEPRALAAVQLMGSLYGNWLQAERDARRSLARNPQFPILLFVLSDILGNVGRWRDARQLSDRLDRKRFLLPGADRKVIVNLWGAGDLQAADEALEAASERWPKHRQVWRTQVAYLLYSGRPDQALAVLNDRAQLPPDIPPGLVATATATARALAGQIAPVDAVAANLDYVQSNPAAALPVAQAAAALGDSQTAMALLHGYYFREGRWAALAPSADRTTTPLFQPPMKSLWPTREFAALLHRTGLEAYWRQSGTMPDFRTPA
jgi:tetratricopeptide (TPR) repeat protein